MTRTLSTLLLLLPLALMLTWASCDSANPGTDPEVLCADGLDNDGDLLTDCADPDCGSSSDCNGPCNYDFVCDADEDAVWCPSDCIEVCGDDICEGDEDLASCPQDCAVCGDGTCHVGEDRVECPEDCALCDDGFCDADEDRTNCPLDCAVCDDGFCDDGEDRADCPEDCAACDDGFCDLGEDRTNCPEDCAVCDDTFCDTGEDRVTCPEDCAACDDGFCDAGEDRISCPEDCIICGDTFCDTGESIANCPLDCATVLIWEEFTSWLPNGWAETGFNQFTDTNNDTWARSTGAQFSQDTILESPTFQTTGYTNVRVRFLQEYTFSGTGVWTGLYVDAPPSYYTIGQPTDNSPGLVEYDISSEAGDKAAVQIEFAIGCDVSGDCYGSDQWRITDVLVYAY